MLYFRFRFELCVRTCRWGFVAYPLAPYYYLTVWLVLDLEFRVCQLLGDPNGSSSGWLLRNQRDRRHMYTPSMQAQTVSSTPHFGLPICQSHKYDDLILHPLGNHD